MTKNKIRSTITREEAADRLAQLSQQLRNGTVSLGGTSSQMEVAEEVEFKADLDDDKLEVELKWET